MKYKIQYKVTVWQEMILDDSQSKEEIIQILQDNTAPPFDVLNSKEFNTLYETEELMTVEENDGQETIELYEDDKIIWTNAELDG